MKGIELLTFLTEEQKRLLETSALNYRRFARVFFQVLEASDSEVVVKVWQNENVADKYLTVKELVERTRAVFNDILPSEVRLHVRPIVYNRSELEKFDAKAVAEKMEQLGLRPKDLVRLLDIDKSSLSSMLSGKRELSKHSRAMLYYFFKYHEKERPMVLNRTRTKSAVSVFS